MIFRPLSVIQRSEDPYKRRVPCAGRTGGCHGRQNLKRGKCHIFPRFLYFLTPHIFQKITMQKYGHNYLK